MSTLLLVISTFILLCKSALDEDEYKDCLWFGGFADTPLYPIGICTTVQNERFDTEDGLYTYSNMYQCTDDGGLKLVEWNNEDCVGESYWDYEFSKGTFILPSYHICIYNMYKLNNKIFC